MEKNNHNLVESIINDKLQQAFTPSILRVVNESHQHNVPEGSESHFKLLVVSDAFSGIRKIQRQQSVYKVLADELAGSVHALTMQTLTPDEWELNQTVVTSPQCMGGSKA